MSFVIRSAADFALQASFTFPASVINYLVVQGNIIPVRILGSHEDAKDKEEHVHMISQQVPQFLSRTAVRGLELYKVRLRNSGSWGSTSMQKLNNALASSHILTTLYINEAACDSAILGQIVRTCSALTSLRFRNVEALDDSPSTPSLLDGTHGGSAPLYSRTLAAPVMMTLETLILDCYVGERNCFLLEAFQANAISFTCLGQLSFHITSWNEVNAMSVLLSEPGMSGLVELRLIVDEVSAQFSQ